MRNRHAPPSLLLLAILASACATIAAEGHGDVDLPNADSGPFRSLKRAEVCTGDVCVGVNELPAGTADGVPKYPGSPPSRTPSALSRSKGDGDLRVVLYAARDLEKGKPARIARFEAADARTFDDVSEVLTADRPQEAGNLGDPYAIDADGAVWLYLSIRPVAGAVGQTPGIVRARSSDGPAGRAFTKDDGLALSVDGPKGAWETEPPRAPAVVRLDDGSFRMLYASGNAIGEATSPDGARFTRLDGDPSTPELDPVIVPSAPVDIAALPEGVKPPFDDLAVDDPTIDRALSPAGRLVWRVHYTGLDRRGGAAIGFAGRFGDAGVFERLPGFVFGAKLHARAPTVVRFASFSLLYDDQDIDTARGIGISIAPSSRKLPIAE